MTARARWGRLTAAAIAVAALTPAAKPAGVQAAGRPNILLIVTDDQGYGDLGIHGNPKLQTPHLDGLARQGVRFRSFYASPVCSPTRASLLTGRYNYRTGIVDTYVGRSLMHGDELTLAEILSGAGYRTGIFGKWHLGDNYPLRAMDQGFQESLTLNGGGIGQPSDPPGGERYFNPLLRRNGQWMKTRDTSATSSRTPRSISSHAIERARSSRTWPSTRRTRRSKFRPKSTQSTKR